MFSNPFSFTGRIRRLEYGLSTIIYFILAFYPTVILFYSDEEYAPVMSLLLIPLWWFFLAQGAKRCHDLDKSGWWQIIPFYVFWMLFEEGQPGKNQYGDNPKNKTVFTEPGKHSEQPVIKQISKKETLLQSKPKTVMLKTSGNNFIERIENKGRKFEANHLQSNHWSMVDEDSNTSTYYIFRTNSELLVSENGIVSHYKWELLDSETLLITRANYSYLYKPKFIDSDIMVLELGNLLSMLVNTKGVYKDIQSINDVVNKLKAKYLTVNLLQIGDEWGGGVVAYVLQPGDPGYSEGEVHGLIATHNNQSTGAQWGCYGTFIGGTSNALGTGAANTAAIVAGCSKAGIAARICNDLELNGYSDWYLPSRDELNKLYINRKAIGGFANKYYWSSSEADKEYKEYSWVQSFGNGSQYGGFRSNTLGCVRAVRSF